MCGTTHIVVVRRQMVKERELCPSQIMFHMNRGNFP